jgi:hypothetical protein
MNYNSYLAIDNLRVLNSDIDSEVCKGPNFKKTTTTATTKTTATTIISSVASTSEKVITTITDLIPENTSVINTKDNVKYDNLAEVKSNFTTALADNGKTVLESTTKRGT